MIFNGQSTIFFRRDEKPFLLQSVLEDELGAIVLSHQERFTRIYQSFPRPAKAFSISSSLCIGSGYIVVQIYINSIFTQNVKGRKIKYIFFDITNFFPHIGKVSYAISWSNNIYKQKSKSCMIINDCCNCEQSIFF